ncbi:MAG: TonB-dependent receptor [Reichenbachiella sp.]|uniref:SusC/RagA family TonB-linked outer membrane protein n=1 Tax=Reichenbachiella sp. TaxID=2184521 RepID=UPI003262F38D
MKSKWRYYIYMISRYFVYIVIIQTVFASLVCAAGSSGQTYEPLNQIEFSLSETKVVSQVFELIERNTDLRFSFDEIIMRKILDSEILFDSNEKNLEAVLLRISRDKSVEFRRINNNIIVSEKRKNHTLESIVEYVSNDQVTGRVLDEFGVGLPGVTILVKDTGIGAVTDLDGNYSLEVPDNSNILTFSYIGYLSVEEEINDRSEINVNMKVDLETLDEVVVVGYGTKKKASITGSVGAIDGDVMLQTRTANLANGLVGKVPGLVINMRGGDPGRDQADILIRGKGTIGNTQPLYVIDGVANRGSFERLNPEDIESISVLKDASAAIYGAQAANGVILITTKRGGEGKPKLSYSNTFSFTQPAKRQRLMNAEQYLTWVDEQNQRNGRPQLYQSVITGYQNGTSDPEVWADTDWWEETMDTWTPQWQHNLSFSGGNEGVKYYVSGQYLYQDAIYKGDAYGFNQYNIRSNIDIMPTDNLELGVDLAGRIEDRNSAGASGDDVEGLIRNIYVMSPFESPYYSNGLLRQTSKGNVVPGLNGANGNRESKSQILNSKISAKLDLPWITQGLSLFGFAAFDFINRDRKDLSKPYDIYFFNSETETYDNLRSQTGTVNLFQQFDEELSKTYHIRLGYGRTFGNHDFEFFVAYEQNQVNGQYISAQRQDLISANLPFLFTGSEVNRNNDGRGWQSARQNYFGRFNYSFKEKYLVEFTLRHDGSQNFASANRFGTFPSMSVGWRLSEELFYHSNLIQTIKIRGSWGILGNDRVDNFQYLQVYNIEPGNVFGESLNRGTGLYPNTTANPNITWESSEKFNVGVDLEFYKGKLDFTLDAFYEERSDILAPRNASVPLFAGLVLPDENIGKTKNQGIELNVLHRGNLSDGLTYTVNGQMTYTKNEIVFLDESELVPDWQKVEGSPIDRLLVYQADGIYQNIEEIKASAHFPDAKPGDVKFVDIDRDGDIDGDDRIILPKGPTPRLVYGLSLGAVWKGIGMNVFIQGQAQASTIYRPWDINQDAYYFENRWISEEETPNATTPAAWDMGSSTIQNTSTIWVRDNDFLRVKNVELSYTFPHSLITKAGLSNLRVYLSGYNLGFIYDKVGTFDPESTSETGWNYPQQRVVSAGLNVTF